jgi:hypothetical protein
MRVEWAFACRTIRRQGADLDATGVGLDTFTLPLATQFIVLMRVAAPEVDCGTTHPVFCRLTGPDLESIESRELGVTLRSPAPEHPEGWEVKAFVPVTFYLDGQRAGTYGLDIWIDGRFRWQVPFRLVAA